MAHATNQPEQWSWLEERTELQILNFRHSAGYVEKAAQAVCPRAERGPWFDRNRVRLKEQRGGARKLRDYYFRSALNPACSK